jgi:peptide/nickel transport system permease protein
MASVTITTPVSSTYVASQWRLIWLRFRKHRVAMVAVPVLMLLYLCVALAEFIAPFSPEMLFRDYVGSRPNPIQFFDTREGIVFGPFIYGLTKERDPETFRLTFQPDLNTKLPVQFFAHGAEYKLWGLFRMDLHLFTGPEEAPLFIFGTDHLGRDVFSSIIYGSRVSLTIGLVGVLLSTFLGLLLGGLAGYFGGFVDNLIMRVVDLLSALPTIPLWMGLAAAIPRNLDVLTIYFAITVVLSFVGWTGLARVVRGKYLSLRGEDYVTAAVISGATSGDVIFRHLLPSFMSYILISLTLAVPGMILGETALSFLGLGIQPPAVSWGTLLRDAQSLQVIAQQPWRLIPCIFVVITVLCYNFIGDGLRDAADPYA